MHKTGIAERGITGCESSRHAKQDTRERATSPRSLRREQSRKVPRNRQEVKRLHAAVFDRLQEDLVPSAPKLGFEASRAGKLP